MVTSVSHCLSSSATHHILNHATLTLPETQVRRIGVPHPLWPIVVSLTVALAQDLPHPSYRPVWTAEVFYDNEDAEIALGSDLRFFLNQQDILALVPSHIRRLLCHPERSTHLEGAQELFILLDLDPDAEALRQLVIGYFEGSPELRRYLS